ncbi:MAG: xanthine dehydrogenase family protein molybdopterin-binding subunit [Gemmatimonadota bacterium]|nr:MAG: xanthine dehydrogenase family protein molybdopterin-binding subunit [Gemmatimonadota bacterium]
MLGGNESVERREGISKLLGRELYIDDEPMGGCLWGATVRSPSPRGLIREVRFGPEVNWEEFVVVDHRDIPGENHVWLIESDQPVLAADSVRHVHEPVVLLAHRSREMVHKAVRSVEVIVDPSPPILDFRIPPGADGIQHGTDNVFSHIVINKGDVEAALAEAPVVVEGTYETGAQEHVYLENQGMVAWIDGDVVVVKGSLQCPFYVHAALTHGLGREEDKVRVIQAPTGGGFGGKEEYPSMLALHAALLALEAGAPVKMIYDRSEDMAVTTKRHPAWIRHRTGVDPDGRLLAQEVEVVFDGGAYVTLSPVVLSRGLIHAGGPYSCDNVRIDGRAVLTNSVPFGAFRGFGAPQTIFAVERQMDKIADELGIDPVELRRMNLIREGQSTATGQIIRDGADRLEVLDRALELSAYREKQKEHARFNAANEDRRRGIGLSTYFHGAGFTGGGEVHLSSVAKVEARPDGRIVVLTSNIEMGQGTLTIFTQIVSGLLGLEPDDVLIADADTFRVPNSGPTVASRTVMVVGRLIERACADLVAKLGDSDLRGPDLKQAIVDWHRKHPRGVLDGVARYEPPPGISWDEDSYRGDAYGAFAWAACVAEVEVDLRTLATRVLDVVAVQEVGKVLNELLASGQIQGGVVQAIGWALMEECVWSDGVMVNNQLTNYMIPTSDDVPPVRVEFLEAPYAHGAGGAKGIGELPLDGPAPALAAAIGVATGTHPRAIPVTPERLMELYDGA